MKQLDPTMAQQVDEAISVFQEQRTGCPPKAVTVVLSDNTLVVTLHEALTPLPLLYWPLLVLTLFCYVLLTQGVKMWLIRKAWI